MAAAYENPLIPNARLREIYVAMAQAGAMAQAQARGPGRARDAREMTGTLGLEACLVSTSIDLGVGDLVSDAVTGGVVDLLRGADGKQRGRKTAALCGMAASLPAATSAAERLWVAMGAAAALKGAAAVARLAKRVEGSPVVNAGVVVAYVQPHEASWAVWRKTLEFAAKQELPIVFVVMSWPRVRGAGGMVGERKIRGVSALSLACGVPAIAVDADDAVAIYRVAQESVGRARAGGGAALLECMPFVLAGKDRKIAAAPAIRTLAQYLLGRKIVTQKWVDRVGTRSKHKA